MITIARAKAHAQIANNLIHMAELALVAGRADLAATLMGAARTHLIADITARPARGEDTTPDGVLAFHRAARRAVTDELRRLLTVEDHAALELLRTAEHNARLAALMAEPTPED